MKLGYTEHFQKYIGPHSVKTIAARQIRYDKVHGIFDIIDKVYFSYDDLPSSFERKIEVVTEAQTLTYWHAFVKMAEMVTDLAGETTYNTMCIEDTVNTEEFSNFEG